MSATTVERTIPPGLWVEIGGLYLRVHQLNDPLLRQDLHRVVVHRDETGHAWVRVSGPNDGVDLQTVPPDTHDFADADGGPL